MVIDLVFLGVIFGITNNHQTAADDCDANGNMVRWLFVFAGYLGAQFVYDFYYTVVFGYAKRTTEVTRAISDFVMTIILYGFGIGWLCYGNWMVYN